MPYKDPRKNNATRARYERRRILYDVPHDGSVKIYDPDFHPEDIQTYFRERFERLRDPQRYATEHRLTYVQEPIRPPTLAGYAAECGISKKTVWAWAAQYEAFEEAVEICKAMQEAMVVELTATNGYNPGFAALMMKNLHGWQDKIEQTHRGGVTLKFDAQDEEA